jgi:hypothetical protein
MNYNLVEMKSYDGDYHDALVAYSDGLDNDKQKKCTFYIK